MDRPQPVSVAARRLPRDPSALAGRRCDPPVERSRHLQMEERPAFTNPQQEAGIDFRRLGRPHPDLDRKAGCLQPRVPLTLHPWIGIFQRRHDPGDSGRHKCIRTGRRTAMMRAGFQGHIGRRALQRQAGLCCLRDRIGFGVRATTLPRPATGDHVIIPYDHAADRGVGPGPPQRPARQRERRAHHRP